MEKKLNGYELSRVWFDFCFENPERIKPNHTAVYFFIIEHCNRLGWKEKFGLPTTMVMEAVGIKSYNTYKQTLNDLVDFGFVTMIERSKNQYSSNIIVLSKFDKALNKALDKALIKHDTKHCCSTDESTVSIDKQYNKEQDNKEPQTILEMSGDENIKNPDKPKKPTGLPFDEFWNLYDKKTGKPKCEKKWNKLPLKDQQAIMAYLPQYKLSQPDKQYRKNPETFLNNRSWEDEIINTDNHGNKCNKTDDTKFFSNPERNYHEGF